MARPLVMPKTVAAAAALHCSLSMASRALHHCCMADWPSEPETSMCCCMHARTQRWCCAWQRLAASRPRPGALQKQAGWRPQKAFARAGAEGGGRLGVVG